MDQPSGDIAVLKKFLKSKGIYATNEFDRLCVRPRRASTVAEIDEKLE